MTGITAWTDQPTLQSSYADGAMRARTYAPNVRRRLTVRRTIMSKWDLQDDIVVNEGDDSGEGLSNQPENDDDDSDND